MATKTKQVTRIDCECNKCHHKWTTRKDVAPKVCPICKRLDWNK